MAQHDYNIGDQNGFDFLVDLNNALSAIATNNAGSSEPNTTFPHMLWFDTNNDLMKMRNQANSAWVIVAEKDGSGWTPYRQGTALDPAEDSSDPNFTNDPNAAARRGLVQQKIINLILDTLPGLVDAELAARLVAGGPGSLVFAYSTGGDVAFGGTVAGSALRPVGAARSVSASGSSLVAVLASGSALTGTWTCLGYFDSTETDAGTGQDTSEITILGATLWQRTL